MGGCEIDLRNAEMAEDSAVIDAFVTMGAVELQIPTNWEVAIEGTPIMGAFENKTAVPVEPKKRLIIKGTVVMGAVEVMN